MEWKRQGVHIAAGFLIILLRFFPYWGILLLCLAGMLFNLFFLPRLIPSIMRNVSGDRRGVVFYPVAVSMLTIAFPNHLYIVAGGWALLAFGDGMATMIGKWIGKSPLKWNPNKTSEGTLAAFIFGFLFCAGACFLVEPTLSNDWQKWLIACLVAAAVAAWVESMPLPINDNLTVPLSGAVVLWGAGFVEASQISQMNGWWVTVAILANGVLASLLTSFRIIQGSATWAGIVVGSIIWVCGGWQSYLMLILFFLMGTWSTRHGLARKIMRGVAQEEQGKRAARHVIANCGVPSGLAFLIAATPYPEWFKVALVASFATAVFDTLGTELGQVYGRYPVLPTNGEVVPVGTEGAISMEGTLLGLFGATILTFCAWIVGGIPAVTIPLVILAAFAGSSAESLLGALIRFDFPWKNEVLNFANTSIGAMVAFVSVCQFLPPV